MHVDHPRTNEIKAGGYYLSKNKYYVYKVESIYWNSNSLRYHTYNIDGSVVKQSPQTTFINWFCDCISHRVQPKKWDQE